jgi:hypothetical protein
VRRIRFAQQVAPFVIAAALTAACGGGTPPAAPAAEDKKIVPTEVGEMSPEEAGGMAPIAEAPPASTAPHGGTVLKLGPTASLEFVHDPSSGLLTAYVLDGSSTTTMRIPAKAIDLQLTLSAGSKVDLSLASTANGLTGDAVGNSSQFGGTQAALKGVTVFSGVVKALSAGGQTYSNVSFDYPQH